MDNGVGIIKSKGVKSAFDSCLLIKKKIMSRPLRIQYPDARYHVMNRGRRGDSIFIDDKVQSLGIDQYSSVSSVIERQGPRLEIIHE